MAVFSGVTFVLFCFVFRLLYGFVEAAALVQSSFGNIYIYIYICRRPDSHPCFFLFLFSNCLFGDVAFSEYFLYHVRFLFVILWRVCVCVFSSRSFWTSSSLDVPAGVKQEEGHTGFLIHLLAAVRALTILARRIQPFFSLVDREVEFCVLTI